jgi:hypothetical protein
MDRKRPMTRNDSEIGAFACLVDSSPFKGSGFTDFHPWLRRLSHVAHLFNVEVGAVESTQSIYHAISAN